jgi:uncharacterized membrane protein YedE/YeeE
MRIISFFSIGVIFGIILMKAEVISWFRIHEMFRFESFHMYGVIGTAVVLGALFMFLMKKFQIRNIDNNLVAYHPMRLNVKRHLIAGSIFGLGWALVGACPGPMYALLGSGYGMFILIILSATLGALAYGATRERLPH